LFNDESEVPQRLYECVGPLCHNLVGNHCELLKLNTLHSALAISVPATRDKAVSTYKGPFLRLEVSYAMGVMLVTDKLFDHGIDDAII
jgi:hypothetical protein